MASSNSDLKRKFDYDRAVQLMSAKDYHEALTEFRGVVAEQPDHQMANFHAGRILLEAFQANEALQWFTRAASLIPEDGKTWQGWAEAVALGGSTDDRAVFLDALKAAPIKPELRVQLQDRFRARRKSSQPNRGDVPKATISALIAGMKRSDFASVEAQATKALKSSPKSAVAAFLLAEAQARLGKTQAAFGAYQMAVKLDPLYAEAYGAMGHLLLTADQPVKAASAFRPAVILAPDMVPALIGLAQCLSLTGNYRAAIILIERCTQLEPRNAVYRTSLADLWKRLGEHDTAIGIYEAALELHPAVKDAPISLRLALADSRSQVGQDMAALDDINAILKETPEDVQAIISKASIMQTQGAFEESSALFRSVVEADPNNGEAYRRMLIGRKTQPDDPIIDAMIQRFDQTDLEDTDRMNLGFALGKALEDVGDDARVFQYLNEANRLAAELSKVSTRQHFVEIAGFRNVFSQIDFHDVPAITENSFAPIFVTGMPRSGTTLVEQIIAAHSTVDSAGELGFAKSLCRGLRTAQPGSAEAADSPEALLNIGRDYTRDVRNRFPDAKRITDKSIYTFQFLGPMKRALPNAKFVVVRRDPRDNLLSMYKNKFKEGTHGYANNLESLARYYDEFDKMVAFWRERIPDWFYEVSYEALVNDPETEARNLIAACGLDWEDDCLNFHKKKSKVQTLSVYQVRQPISNKSVSGWRRYEAELAPMIEQLKRDGHVTD